MQPYSNSTRRNMEDNLNFFKGRQLNFLKIEDDLKKKQQKTSKVKMILFLKMEDDLKY
jgi:hypothetical protein